MRKFVHRFKWPDRKKHKHADGSYHRVAEPYHEFAGWVFDAAGGGVAGSFVNAALADKPMPESPKAPPNSPARPASKPAKAATEGVQPAPPAAKPTPQIVKPAPDHPAPKRRSYSADGEASKMGLFDDHHGNHEMGGRAPVRRSSHGGRTGVDDGESFT